ncbi:MAG: PTS sugar transporter subunit IIA [Spirochaetes bacterium]|nr:PTS sugar transporter subunit IIA [Spirochaetota bacterium]
MLISEIFKPGNIKINLESQDKEELFEEIVNFIVDAENLENRDEILKALWDRERKMTTGIAPNIAIPHTNLVNIKKTIGVLGISRNGIDYDSLDGKPVHIIFFLIGDKNNPNEHLAVLKNLALMINIPDFYNDIINCTSSQKVTEKIVEFEDLLKFSIEKK